MKAYWGSGDITPLILNVGTRLRWVASFTPRPLYPRCKPPGTRWIGGWVGPRAGLEAVAKRNNPYPYRKSYSGLPACTLVTIVTEITWLLTKL